MTSSTSTRPAHGFEQDDGRRSIVLPGFRLDFHWLGDRWTHALAIPGQDLAIVRAVEGDADRDEVGRVVSPAYQQIHLHDESGVPMALLVGQSGPHHFSATFAVRAIEDSVLVEVDVADRCRVDILALACTYVVEATSSDLLGADDAGANWSLRHLSELAFRVEPPSASTLGEAGRRATQVQALAKLLPGAATHRCCYCWRFLPTS